MINPLQSTALLNFAFCPAQLIDLDKNNSCQSPLLGKGAYLAKEHSNDEEIGGFAELHTKYFYVCYSFELEKELYKGKNYFYFQIFYQTGADQGSFDPFFGIFSENQTVNFLNEIDSFFHPSQHEKKMFDNADLAVGSCHTLVQLMQQWTSLKIIEFTNEYVNYISEEMLSKMIAGKLNTIQKRKRRTPKKDENKDNQIKKPRKKREPKKDN